MLKVFSFTSYNGPTIIIHLNRLLDHIFLEPSPNHSQSWTFSGMNTNFHKNTCNDRSFGRTPDVDDVSNKRKQKRAKDDGHHTHSLSYVWFM